MTGKPDAGVTLAPAAAHPAGGIGILAAIIGLNALVAVTSLAVLAAIAPADRAIVGPTVATLLAVLLPLSGVVGWWWWRTLGRWRAAEADAAQRATLLLAEIAAHRETDAALQRAKEVAEAANLAKSRYLVGVSHEIRSPLNAIYGYAQLLERGAGIAPQEAGGIIRRSSEHLTNIVDGLLDISRIESGVLKLSRDVVPLPALLESLVAMFRVEAENKGLQFHYHPAANLPAFVRTDEKRLRQILINLLSNAIKYTPKGEASLTVRYRGLIAEFDVADTGIGIPAGDLERVFEPFERGSAERAQAQPGTGLGLAITRVLAQVMGGDIAVTSTPGVGSVFKLRLMLAAPGDAVAATARQRQISGYGGRRRTILLIDDDPAQLAVLQSLLRPLGFNVYAASNGADGLDLALRCAPDLVLLDLQMPGLSGWAVAERLRALAADGAGTLPKILLVSANAHEFSAGADGGAAHDGFVTKPVELEALLDAIAGQLGLDWQSAPDVIETPAPAAADLAPAQIAELRRLGKAGHVRGLEAALAALADAQPASRPRVAPLQARVRAFDLEGFLRLLDAGG
jgi:signal transduction histidine kinase/ActR/RegA family two-component response regulator